jgi:hypothetical protein
LLRQLLPPADVIRGMVTAWTYASTEPLLESDDDAFSRTGLETLDREKLGRDFLKAYWCNPTSDQPEPEGQDRRQTAYCLGQQFARVLNVWIRGKLTQRTLSPQELGDLSWNLGVDLELLRQSDTDPSVKDGRLEVGNRWKRHDRVSVPTVSVTYVPVLRSRDGAALAAERRRPACNLP